MIVPDVAVISGAGWKGGEIEVALPPGTIPYRCPELLFPLADGNTVLSRLVKQLHGLGVHEVYAGVGNPDCYRTWRFEAKLRKRREHTPPGMPGDPPWTWARVQQVRQLGVKVVMINNPFNMGSCWETMRILLQSLEGKGIDKKRVIGIPGDYVFDTAYLRHLVQGAVYPSIWWVMPVHDLLFLNDAGRRTLTYHLATDICRNLEVAVGGTRVWKDREVLGKAGIQMRYQTDWKDKAPWTGHNYLPSGLSVEFSELGTKYIEWDAAQRIAEEDPV